MLRFTSKLSKSGSLIRLMELIDWGWRGSGMVGGGYIQWCSGVTSYKVQGTMWNPGFTEVGGTGGKFLNWCTIFPGPGYIILMLYKNGYKLLEFVSFLLL